MNRKFQLDICKKCIHKGFDPKQGIVCSLTKQKPDFEEFCPTYAPIIKETVQESKPIEVQVSYSFNDDGLFTQSSSGVIHNYYEETRIDKKHQKATPIKRDFLFLLCAAVFGLLFIRILSYISVTNHSGTIIGILLYSLVMPFIIVWHAKKRQSIQSYHAGPEIINYILVLITTSIFYFIYVELALWHLFLVYSLGFALPVIGSVMGIPMIFLARKLMQNKKSKK